MWSVSYLIPTPRPDVIATKGKLQIPYPTKAVEIAIEILSPDDPMPHILRKCWPMKNGASSSSMSSIRMAEKFTAGMPKACKATETLSSIAVEQIWHLLDQALL